MAGLTNNKANLAQLGLAGAWAELGNMWFKTNDEQDSVPIEVEDVSKYAYVVLLKRKI